MALGDTYFIKCSVYFVKISNSAITELGDLIGERNIYYPYMSASPFSGSTNIINGGLITANYDTLLQAMPDFALLTGYNVLLSSSRKPNQNFYNYFPNFEVFINDNGFEYLAFVNKANNRTLLYWGNGVAVYDSLNDAYDSTKQKYWDSTGCFSIAPNSGSGGSRGSCNTLFYDGIVDGVLTFKRISFNGVSSTSNSINCTNVSGINSLLTNTIRYFMGDPQPLTPDITDPYNNFGTTGNDDTEGIGGTGDGDTSSDVIDIPTAPTFSASDTGFITLFNPSLQEMKDLASYMWTGLFDVDSFKKIFANPMDCILGLSLVPVSIPGGTPISVKVGNISTGVNMTPATAQYVDVDCGTVEIKEFWGAYLDYSPYTKAELYLPYIGIHAISIDDIMGKTIAIKYRVDILSGACVAFVKCGDSVLYSFIGQCASSIPITGNDWTNMINGIMSIAGAVGSMVASGGMTAPLVAPGVASTAINSMKPTIEKSGSLSGAGGLIGLQKPYFIITRPRQALPEKQNTFTGYPSFITRTLSTLQGYAEIESVHLENIPATNSEIEEIEAILKKGVIF